MPSQRNQSQNRSVASGTPGLNTTRRTWQNGGLSFTMETTSYSNPGASFSAFSTTANTTSRRSSIPAQNSSRSTAAGLLGATFGLFDTLLTAQQQRRQQVRQQSTRPALSRQNSRQPQVEDLAYSDEEDEFEDDEEESDRPRASRTNLADKHVNDAQKSRTTRPASPVRRGSKHSQTAGKSQSYKRGEQESKRDRRFESRLEDEDYDTSDDSSGSSIRHSFGDTDAAITQSLENAAEHESREMRRCKRRLEQASRRQMGAAELQSLLDELKNHESAYTDITRDLNNAKAGSKNKTTQPRRASQHARPSASRASSRTMKGGFSASFGSNASFRTQRAPNSIFTDFDDFDAFPSFGGTGFTAFEQFFNDMHVPPGFGGARSSSIPHAGPTSGTRPQARSSTTGAGRQFPPTGNPPIFPTPSRSQPPANLLKPAEAKQLFQTYNERWTALAPTDPNIPYPCRSLQSRGLMAKDNIWAPKVSTPIATWSADTTMQANAQAFFIGAVGMTPTYTEAPATGKIIMGYDKARANAEQVRQLVEVLKKEKIRWHSDRLGRRNAGKKGAADGGGVNEALQRDEKARAVFHACCELMEFTQ